MNKILIAVDDSKYAQHAAEMGFDIARNYKAEVGLVSVVDPIIYPASGMDPITGIPVEGTNINEEILKAQTESAKSIIQQTIKRFAGDMQVIHFSEYGSTTDSIVKCADEFKADLIVIGTHSRTGLDRLIMGSVAEHVVRHSKVPVLVVPLKDEI